MSAVAAAAAVGPVLLPELDWKPTKACSSRHGAPVVRVVVHRWGVRYTGLPAEARTYEGVIGFFENDKNGASAHVVFPGSAVPGKATQMVAWADKAWAEAAYNPSSDDIECADAIWLGHDPVGLHVLARMVAKRLHARGIPCVWSAEHGFCRHADLGAAGGGHFSCPTTSTALWHAFCGLVEHEYHRLPFRPVWGR